MSNWKTFDRRPRLTIAATVVVVLLGLYWASFPASCITSPEFSQAFERENASEYPSYAEDGHAQPSNPATPEPAAQSGGDQSAAAPTQQAPRHGTGFCRWAGHFGARALNDPIAWFTFVLMAATLLVYWATRRLWRGSERHSEIDLRAYVSIEAGFILDGTTTSPQELAFSDIPYVELRVRNSGRTPAREINHWMNIAVLPRRDEDTLKVPDDIGGSPAILLAGGAMPKGLRYNGVLNAQQIADIHNGASALYVYGKISYLDVFNRRRTTTYRLFFVGLYPPDPLGSVFSFCAKGNSMD